MATTGPMPPLPEGWHASFDQQSNQWHYVQTASGQSQWQHPGVVHALPPPSYNTSPQSGPGAQPTYHEQTPQANYTADSGAPSPPNYLATNTVPAGTVAQAEYTTAVVATDPASAPEGERGQQSGGFFSKFTQFTSNPAAKTGLTVAGSLAAGALLEHEVSEFSQDHNIHGPGMGTMASLLGAAGLGALGGKMFGNKQSAQPPPPQAGGYPAQSQYPPPGQSGGQGQYPPPGQYPPQPGYSNYSPPPFGPPQTGRAGFGTLGNMAAGAGLGMVGAAAGSAMLHHHDQNQNQQPAGPGFGASVMNSISNSGKPRLIIQAASYAGEDVTRKIQGAVKDDQSILLNLEEINNQLGDPFPGGGWCRNLVVLYQYGDRPMEVYATINRRGINVSHQPLTTDRMKYVNTKPGRIVALIWGTVNILTETRVETLEKDGEMEAVESLGECGTGIGTGGYGDCLPVLTCFYRNNHGGVSVANARYQGTMRLPWNPLAKWN